MIERPIIREIPLLDETFDDEFPLTLLVMSDPEEHDPRLLDRFGDRRVPTF